MRRFLLPALILAFGASQARADDSPKPVALGGKVPNSNSLRDLRGNRRALHDFKSHKAIVLFFVGAECPVSNLYFPEVVALEKKYREKEVQFLAVYPNEHEDLDQIAGHAYDRDPAFPTLKDAGQRLADSLGVKRVPTVVVLDGDFSLRYRGRVDDRYGVAAKKPKAGRDDLVSALDEVIGGKKVSIAETEADGCLLDRPVKPKEATKVTYAKDVAPLLQKHCQACHRPDQAAPFSLVSYDNAVRHARMIKEVTTQRRMPPWHADPRYGKFSNDRRLTKDEIRVLAEWVDGGMPKGDDKDLPKPAIFPKGWVHGKPDLVLTMPHEFEVPATGVLPYKNYVVDTGFTEDKWVRVAEAKPGTPSVVHHVVVYIQDKDQRAPVRADGSLSVLVGWAPGDLGLVCDANTAVRVPKGSKLRMEMHYTPNGTVTKDRSSVGLTFAKSPPKFEMFMNEFANMGINVPAHDPHYKAEAAMRLPADARLLSFVPHMHWRGKDYRYEIIYPGGKRETILSVPRWDFNWQNVYRFEEPLKLPKGAKLHAVAHWDNSKNNLLNPAPEKKVPFGLQTWDEMMVGWACYVWERPETAAELAKNPPSRAEQLFDRLDVNADDFITPDEIPERMRPFIALSGLKLPEKMARDDFIKTFDGLLGKGGKAKDKPKDKK